MFFNPPLSPPSEDNKDLLTINSLYGLLKPLLIVGDQKERCTNKLIQTKETKILCVENKQIQGRINKCKKKKREKRLYNQQLKNKT